MGHLDLVSIPEHQWPYFTFGQGSTIWFNRIANFYHYVRRYIKFCCKFTDDSEYLYSLLMFGSGVPTAEKPQAKKFYLMSYGMHSEDEHSNAWRQYKAYLKRTSILIPLPPSLYTHIPEIFKKTLLLDFPIYRFDEEKDGSSAREEDRKRIEDA